jgi:hypothetical protein
MLAALLLLLIATASGTLLTFVYDRSAPMAARLCMGASTGLVLMAAIGFLLALTRLGLSAASIGLTAAIMLLPFLLLSRKRFREAAAAGMAAAPKTTDSANPRPALRKAAYVAFYACFAILFAIVFVQAAYKTPEGLYTGVRNNLGDLTLHLQVISSFAQGQNLPPEDPTFAGVRFAYPFLTDFLAAMFMRCGAGILGAMWLENMVLAMALVGIIHYWTLLLTQSRLAGMIAPVLVIFSGGFGWTWILQEVHNTTNGLIPLLWHLPHDYTIEDAPSILRWGNSMTTLFVTQRSILLGMPLAICIFCLWWKSIAGAPGESDQDQPYRRMAAAGLFAGLLPLTHAHTFLVVTGTAACLALLFLKLWRSWLLFFALAGIVALPQVLWLGRAGGVQVQSYLAWQPGWDHGAYNPALFWLVNTGLFIPLLVVALGWRRPEKALPTRLLMFYSPFLFCFIVPNLVRLAPWIWDNVKVLIYWYVASAPLVALVLARGFRQKSGWRWLAAGAFATLILSGGLDIFRVVSGQTVFREFDRDGIALASAISTNVSPRALVLHAPNFYSPVFLTGRRSLLGYPGWIASRGLDYSQRESEIVRIYAGAPDAEALLRRYQVDYVLVGPAELAAMPVSPQFWARYPEAARVGQYRLYRTNISGERARQ